MLPNPKTIAIYCGGLEVLSGLFEKLETYSEEEMIKKKEELRTRIIEILNQRAEITNIKDLFKKPPAVLEMGKFNPIIFDFRLPSSLQSSRKIKWISEIWTFETEEYQIIFDGRLLMIAAPCSLQERPTGIIDVRDKFIELLKPLSPKRIVPCVTHHAFVLTTSKVPTDRESKDVYIQIGSRVPLTDVIRDLYLTINVELDMFYYTCELRREIDYLKDVLVEAEESLFKALKDLEICRWWNILKKRQNLKRIKAYIIKILEKLAEYPTLMRRLQNNIKDLKRMMQEVEIFKVFMESNNWLEYTMTEPLETEAFTQAIEYAHREIEVHQVTTSEMKAALIGGLAGASATLLLSYFLSFF